MTQNSNTDKEQKEEKLKLRQWGRGLECLHFSSAPQQSVRFTCVTPLIPQATAHLQDNLPKLVEATGLAKRPESNP